MVSFAPKPYNILRAFVLPVFLYFPPTAITMELSTRAACEVKSSNDREETLLLFFWFPFSSPHFFLTPQSTDGIFNVNVLN